jgi:hypothetical protein
MRAFYSMLWIVLYQSVTATAGFFHHIIIIMVTNDDATRLNF